MSCCSCLFQFLLDVWAKDLNSREDHVKRGVQGKLASATHSQTESYLRPLFRKLRKKVRLVEMVKLLYLHGCCITECDVFFFNSFNENT